MPLLTINERHDRRAACKAEMEAILDKAKGESRPLTTEECGQFDALKTECDQLKAEILAAEEEQDRQTFLEGLQQEMKQPRRTPRRSDPVTDQGDGPRPKMKTFQGTLRAFDTPEDAFRSGMHLIASMHALSRDGLGDCGVWAERFCREHGVKLAVAQSEGDNTRGGYLVYPTMEAAIVKLREQYGVVRREFAVKQMTSDVHSWPREVGSHTVYYPEENGEITASTMKWDQCTLTAKKAAALARMSRELSEDAVVSIADEIANNMAWKFAYAEDRNGFVGDGTSTYGGMTGIVTKINDASGVTYAGSIVEAIAGNTAFSTLDLADFEAVIGKTPTYALPGAKWYISQAGWAASMLRLLDAAGGNTSAILAGQAEPKFLGYPVVISQVLNSTLAAQASTVILLFGDLTKCCFLGNRRGITVDTSADRYFEYDQIAIRATERFAITCVPGDPVAPTTAAGPVIALKTPSA